jgi:hypothetical protein
MTERDLEKENAELRARLEKLEDLKRRRNESSRKWRASSSAYKENRQTEEYKAKARAAMKKHREKDPEAYRAKNREYVRLWKERKAAEGNT